MGRTRSTIRMLTRLWPIGRFFNWLGRRPWLARILDPWFNSTTNQAIMIPVHQVIEGTQSLVLPYLLLPPIIEQASQCVVLDFCMCRVAEGCRNYPHEIGCLLLGPGADKIHPTLGRKINPDEARRHLEKAMQAGLVPLIVHTAFDALVLGIPYHSMLAICFCCDCCCTVRSGLRMGPPAFWDAVERLPGIQFTVQNDCVGCGACARVCPMRAIQVQDGKARISEQCKGCGRCISVCPRGCIQIDASGTADLPDRLIRKLLERTQIN